MAKKYLEKLTEIFNQINSKEIKDSDFEIKPFFNGAAVYVDKKICISFSPTGFAIKLPEELRENLLKEKSVKHLRYFKGGHVKKEYLVISKKILENKRLLIKLIKAY